MTAKVVCPVLPELLMQSSGGELPRSACLCMWPVWAGPSSYDKEIAPYKARGWSRLHTPDSPIALWLKERRGRPSLRDYPDPIVLLEVDTSAGKFLLKLPPPADRSGLKSGGWCPPQPEDPRWLRSGRLRSVEWVGAQSGGGPYWLWRASYKKALFRLPKVEFMYARTLCSVPEGRGLPGNPSKFVDDISLNTLSRPLCEDCLSHAALPPDFEPSEEDMTFLQRVGSGELA